MVGATATQMPRSSNHPGAPVGVRDSSRQASSSTRSSSLVPEQLTQLTNVIAKPTTAAVAQQIPFLPSFDHAGSFYAGSSIDQPWSAEEDALLHSFVQTLGHQWKKIAELLPGRSKSSTRNRWIRIGKAAVKAAGSARPSSQGYLCRRCGLPKKGHHCGVPAEEQPVLPSSAPVPLGFDLPRRRSVSDAAASLAAEPPPRIVLPVVMAQPLGVYMPDSPHPLTGGPSVDSVERSFLSELQASLEPAEQPAAAASPLFAAGVCLAAAAPAAAPTQPAADPTSVYLSLDILAEESEAAAQALARRVPVVWADKAAPAPDARKGQGPL